LIKSVGAHVICQLNVIGAADHHTSIIKLIGVQYIVYYYMCIYYIFFLLEPSKQNRLVGPPYPTNLVNTNVKLYLLIDALNIPFWIVQSKKVKNSLKSNNVLEVHNTTHLIIMKWNLLINSHLLQTWSNRTNDYIII